MYVFKHFFDTLLYISIKTNGFLGQKSVNPSSGPPQSVWYQLTGTIDPIAIDQSGLIIWNDCPEGSLIPECCADVGYIYLKLQRAWY